jgi:hypothetical protein
MSELNNDRIEGKRNALKDVDAPLREQISKKLFKRLKEMDVPQKAVSIWEGYNSNRVLWSERQKAWLGSWDKHLVSDNSGPFEGSSQLHIPMPYTVVKTMHARFIQAIWQDPPFSVRPQNEASTEQVELVRDVIRWYLMRGCNYNKGAGKVVDLWVWDWLSQGSGVMKLKWDVCYTKYTDIQLVNEPGPTQFQNIDGQDVAIPTTMQREKEVERVKKTHDCPVFELVNLEDLAIVGGAGDPDAADAVIHRTWLTASDLFTLSDRKIFDKEAVEKIIDAGPDRQDGATGNDIKADRAQNAGKSQLDHNYDLDQYEILEEYLKVDVDNSGITSDIVVWIHPRSRELLRATYLYRMSKSGQKPFIKADFQPRKGQEYGVGLVEMLYPLSKEMDAMHNMRIDWGMISVMPFGFYKPTSGIDPTTINFEPGALIPVDNPQTDVFFPNMGNRTIFGMQEEAAIQTMVERITSISDLNLGLMNGQGATRTATGARALVGEMSSNLDVFLRRLNWGWEKGLRLLMELTQTNVPKGLTFRLTGDSGSDIFRKLNDAKDIQGDFDIEVSPNSDSSNQSIQIEKARELLQLVSNPMAIQLQIVQPGNYYAAIENFLRAQGHRDFGKYITKPQGYERSLSPNEMLARALTGRPAKVHPSDDHMGFIELWEAFKNNDEQMGQITAEQAITAEQQAKQHTQMQEALDKMAAQQANAGQMQQNAAMSSQQTAPTNPGGPLGGGAA